MHFTPETTNTGPAFLTVSSVQASSPILNSDGQPLAAGELQAYRTYILQWRAPISSFRIVAGDVTPGSIANAVTAQTAGISDLISGLTEQVEGDFESSEKDGVDWFVWDQGGRAIMGWGEGGLVTYLDDLTLSDAGPRILADPALEATISAPETIDGRVLQYDADGQALLLWRSTDGAEGFDAHMHPQF